jgi:hypothetical protein
MTQEERDILLKDLSARLPYGVKVQLSTNEVGILHEVAKRICTVFTKGRIIPPDFFDVRINDIKLYLFPLSSLTEEQKEELADMEIASEEFFGVKTVDWLNAHHFDYRGLISRGLAVDATNLNIY